MYRTRILTGFMLVLAFQTAAATETSRWIVDTAGEFLAGRGQGVEVTPDGVLQRVADWGDKVTFEEPVVMAGAMTSDGALLVGTGHPARLYRVLGGETEILTDVPAEQITAIVVREDGGVVLATIAPGVVFEWSNGSLREVGRLAEGGIWDMALFDGQVVVAGGPPAALYRLADRGLERWLELPDLHARCLEVTSERLLVGTSGKGLIVGVERDGGLSVLADSPFTEISDLAFGNGSVWAAALVGDPAPSPPKSNGTKSGNGNGNGAEVEAEVSAGADLKLPKVNGKTATSEIIQLTPEGGLLSVHRFTREVAGSIAWDGGGLLVGTGWEGEVWRFVSPDGGTRLSTVDAVQVVGVVGGGAALLTQGPGGVLLRDRDTEKKGTFRSAAKQFKQPVRFGEYRVEPAASGVRIRFRTGISAKPDATWLDWTGWMAADGGVVGLPAARALQWEVELPFSNGGSATVGRVEVALVEVNLPPRVKSLTVEEPGVVYLAAPPPSGPVIEAVHPDVNGIFTVIDEQAAQNGKSAKGRKFYRAGFRTVGWAVSDPNDDPLRFVLEIEGRDGHRIPVREQLLGTQLGIDTSAMPDGTYRFKLTASDAPGNPTGAREASRASRWFAIDNTPPSVGLERSGDKWVAAVTDNLSPIVRAEWSRDGETWNPLAPTDGVLDGREERFEFAAAEGSHLVVVRVVDRQHNRSTAGAVEN